MTTAFTGSASTLNIGTYNYDTGVAIDADGIDATIALTGVLDTAGYILQCNGAQVATTSGATALSAAAFIGWDYDTAAFTAGQAELIVEYIVPVS